jgi:hypothetical protein
MGGPRPSSRYQTDPPSVKSSGQPIPTQVLDVKKTMDMYRAGKIDGISIELPHPNDELLIATLMSLGTPRHGAEMLRVHPGMRLAAYEMWGLVQMAARGNAFAKEQVDMAIAMNEQLRKDDMMADDPTMTAGFWER